MFAEIVTEEIARWCNWADSGVYCDLVENRIIGFRSPKHSDIDRNTYHIPFKPEARCRIRGGRARPVPRSMDHATTQDAPVPRPPVGRVPPLQREHFQCLTSKVVERNKLIRRYQMRKIGVTSRSVLLAAALVLYFVASLRDYAIRLRDEGRTPHPDAPAA